MIEWPAGQDIVSPEVTRAVTAAHEALEDQPGVGNVWSAETLRRWLRDMMNDTSPETLRVYMERLPAHVVGRFVNESANAAVITGRLNNMEAEETSALVDELNERLAAARAAHPDMRFTVSGLSVVASQQASSMISQLSVNLLATIFIVIGLIGLAFRSIQSALLSVIPNIFPITAAGTLLYLSGGGLEYASIIGLIVAFGLAVDDTIHFLSRLRIEEERSATLDEAVNQTLSRLGPVLILTTMVMVVGIGVTVFSDLPQMRMFGGMMMVTLAAALAADLLILPAIILTLRRFISTGEQPVGRTT
jgi:predicted RND superfamily exporter protein